MTLKSAPCWWHARDQMSRMQQMNHRGWRTSAPSAAPSALPTSWKPSELKMWSKGREEDEEPRWDVGCVVTRVPQVAPSLPNSDEFGFSFLSSGLPTQFQRVCGTKIQCHFFSASFTFSSFRARDRAKQDNGSPPAGLHLCGSFPVVFLRQRRKAEKGGGSGEGEGQGAACTLLHGLLLWLDH